MYVYTMIILDISLLFPPYSSVRKVFRRAMSLDDQVKLTDENISGRMVKRVGSGNFTIEHASRIYGITVRSGQQLTKMYCDTGKIPKLKPKRRPKKHLRDNTRKLYKDLIPPYLQTLGSG